MLNLAPIRYARILERDGGPVRKIEYSRVTAGGRAMYQAQAWLSERLRGGRAGTELFGDADGMGTHYSAMVARHKAISEAIERWALYYLYQGGFTDLYGLGEDSSSTGMAAYPGLFATQARRRAQAEAIERYCLAAWWEGLLPLVDFPAGNSAIRAWRIENPLGREAVILTSRQSGSGYYVYGYSASHRARDAYRQAVIEMERANSVLSRYYLDNPGFEKDDLSALANPMERRVLYFSLPEGHHEFEEHVRTAGGGKRGNAAPEKLVDAKVEGPWNDYATVWRVLYRMPSQAYLGEDAAVFYW